MKRALLGGLATLLLCGLTPSFQGGLKAQEVATMQAGDKVRIGLVDERDRRSGVSGLPGVDLKLKRVSGTLIRIESDTIFIRLNEAAAVRYSLSNVIEIDRWGGSKAPAVTAIIGGIAGGILGGVIMKSATDQELGFWLGAAPAAPAGAIAGWYFMSLKSWRLVSVEEIRFGGPSQQGIKPLPVVQPQAEFRISIPIH